RRGRTGDGSERRREPRGRRRRGLRRDRRTVVARMRPLPMPMPEELTTRRLFLRPYHWQDIDDVMAYATDEASARYLPVPWPYTRRDAEQFLASQVLLDPAREARWAIVLDGTVVGGVNLRRSPEHRLAELGYALARAVWGRGLATEAARAVIRAAFEA